MCRDTYTDLHARQHRRQTHTKEGWTNGWSRLATPMRGLKAKAKMADVHEIRGASVTARSSAPVQRGFPFRWLLPTHPRRHANEPSLSSWASATLRRIVQDHHRQPPPCPLQLLAPRSDRTPAIPLEEFISGTFLAGQSAPKSAELRDERVRVLRPARNLPPRHTTGDR